MPVVGLQDSLSFSNSNNMLLRKTELAVKGSGSLQALRNGLDLVLCQLSRFESEISWPRFSLISIPGFLSLGATEIWGWIILCCRGAVLGTAGSLAATLAAAC